MKNLIITITLVLALSSIIYAQGDQYINAMNESIAMIDYSSEVEELTFVANKFERIASAEPDQWLPSYYSAYINMIIAQKSMQSDKDKMEACVEKAQAELDKAKLIVSDNSEVHVLQGYIYMGNIWSNPMLYGAKYSPKAYAEFDKAIELDPSNPRPYYLKGQNTFYTPSFFGGGKDNAKPLLLEADRKFDTFKKADELSPTWGKGGNNYMLKQCGVEVDNASSTKDN